MKTTFNYLFALTLVSITFFSCQKEELDGLAKKQTFVETIHPEKMPIDNYAEHTGSVEYEKTHTMNDVNVDGYAEHTGSVEYEKTHTMNDVNVNGYAEHTGAVEYEKIHTMNNVQGEFNMDVANYSMVSFYHLVKKMEESCIEVNFPVYFETLSGINIAITNEMDFYKALSEYTAEPDFITRVPQLVLPFNVTVKGDVKVINSKFDLMKSFLSCQTLGGGSENAIAAVVIKLTDCIEFDYPLTVNSVEISSLPALIEYVYNLGTFDTESFNIEYPITGTYIDNQEDVTFESALEFVYSLSDCL